MLLTGEEKQMAAGVPGRLGEVQESERKGPCTGDPSRAVGRLESQNKLGTREKRIIRFISNFSNSFFNFKLYYKKVANLKKKSHT